MTKHYKYTRDANGYWTFTEDPHPFRNMVRIAVMLLVATVVVWGLSSIEAIDFTPSTPHSPQVPF